MSDSTPEEARKAEQEKLARERMAAFGYDPTNQAELAKFQELESKLAAGRIEQQDILRGMEKFAWEQADKERRDAERSPEKNQQEQQRDDREAARRQLDRYEKNNPPEAERTAVRAEFDRYMNTTEAAGRDHTAAEAARAELQKHIADAERGQAPEQTPNLQRKTDIDRGNF
jgi:hypothetical protein